MTHADIHQVLDVDRESYPVPWPASAYRRELNNNSNARYVVLRQVEEDTQETPDEIEPDHRGWRSRLPWMRGSQQRDRASQGRLIGYAGMWLVADEAHITTVAVRAADRGRGFGELLLARLVELAYSKGTRWVTLEVRMSNDVAQGLYRKYGFRKAGLRRRYYSDNNEDALIMTTDDITLNAYQQQFRELTERLAGRLGDDVDSGFAAAPERTPTHPA